MDRVTRTIVNRRYLPSRGTASDVGGMISASSKKKTVSDSRIDTQRVTCDGAKFESQVLAGNLNLKFWREI